MANVWVFRSTWELDAPVDRVYEVLADVENYPTWWPQVRRARRIDDASGELVCRSVLPYDLTFTMRREIEDPATGVLRARMTGDLDGVSQWTISPDGSGARAVFDEDASVSNNALRAAGRFFRPVLRMNHDAMMRAGEKGLRNHLRNHLR